MMQWSVHVCDVLTEPADVLVCSANPYLNLSGGVGGEILRRYGEGMQKELHAHLAARQVRFVPPGAVVQTSPGGTHFRAVLHAVAIDAFYASSPELVRRTVETALELAASLNAKRVALVALATGYGPMSIQQFGKSVAPLRHLEFPPIESVIICVRRAEQRSQLEALSS